MADKTLIVPIRLSALAVNKAFEYEDVRRWRMNFFQLARFSDPEPLPFQGEIEDGFYRKSKNWGVYLHWMLPLALRKQQIKDHKEQQPYFPPLPNRWVVVRNAQGTSRYWLIKSDELDDQNDGGSTFVNEQGVTKLGKSAPPKTSLSEVLTGANDEKNRFKPLTALGYGDVNFLAYQPLINDVFSVHDPMTDENGNFLSGSVDYRVAGWYSDAADEILKPKDEKTVAALLDALQWKVKGNNNPDELNTLTRSLYVGKLNQVQWKDAKPGYKDHGKSFRVAVGNNAIDAWMALIKDTDKAGTIPPATLDFLKAFLYGEVPLLEEAGGKIRFEREVRKSWFQAQSGGVFWTLEKHEKNQAFLLLEPGGKKEAPNEALPEHIKTDLEKLNEHQKKSEQLHREHKLLQKLLYDAWWYLNGKKNTTPSDSPTLKQINKDLDTLKNRKKGRLASAISTKDGEIKTQEDGIKTSKKAIEDALLILDQDSAQTYHLVAKARFPFWQTHDPTVLISGIMPRKKFDTDEALMCRASTEELDKQLEQVLEKELKDATGAIEWEQPWNPLFIEWEMEWFALPFVTKQNGKKKAWEYKQGDYQFSLTTQNLEDQGYSKAHGHIIRGRNFLEPQTNSLFFRQFEQLKAMTPAKQQESTGWKQLESFVNAVTKEKFLSQPLKDFNAQRLLHQTQLSLLPDDPGLKDLIGDQVHSQPFNPVSLPDDFNGLQQGQFKINKLLVYDGFGQCITLVGGRGLKNERNFIPVKDASFKPAKDAAVWRWNPHRFMEYKPRILEFTRLQFDFVDAQNEEKLINLHKDTNPICGWVIHNHLDKSLAYFDNQGRSQGETRIIQGAVHNHETPVTANTVFKDFIGCFSQMGMDDFEEFLSVVDETLLTIDPSIDIQDQHLAMWMGKPLALVKTRLHFQCYERPVEKFEELLDDIPTLPHVNDAAYLKKLEQGFRDFTFDVNVGSQGIRQDGLIGYFTEGKFYAVHARERFTSDFIRPLKEQDLATDFTSPIDLVLLIDPRARVYAQCGLLPYAFIELPAHFINEGLEKIQVHFRFHSLLTTVQKAAEDKAPDVFALPLPALQKGSWHWEEKALVREKTDPNTPGSEKLITKTFDIEDAPAEPSLPTQGALIRDGNLVLKDLFGNEPSS